MTKTAQPLLRRARPRHDLEIPLVLDRGDARPLATQLADQWRQAVLDGRLAAHTRLPSSRVLARTLGVSRHVVLQAVEELMIEGYLTARQGSGVTVSADVLPAPTRATPAPPTTHRWQGRPAPPLMTLPPPSADAIEFRLGEPSVDRWLDEDWRRTWREVGAARPPGHYGDPQGELELRVAIAAYLARARGVACRPEQVLITTSSRASLHLLIHATVNAGDPVGLEEPGYRLAQELLLQRGAARLPCPVDEDGLRIDALPDGHAAPVVLYCTPSHQYPLGGRLSLPRRLALLRWARQHDVLIVEDDYDSEFRFDAAPLPALAALDEGGQVVYLGTFAKSLTPSLRLGYMVGAPATIEHLLRHKQLVDGPVSWPLQRALTLALQRGLVERHISGMRREYARKRAVLTDTFRAHPHLGRPTGLEAGFHLVLELPAGFDADRVIAACAARQVIVYNLDRYHLGPPTRSGLVLGYGSLTLADIQRGAAVIVQALQAEQDRLSARPSTHAPT